MCIVCLTVASAVAVAVSLTTSSCSKKDVKPENTGILSTSELPQWVINPYSELSEGIIAGVGISNKPGANGPNWKYLIIQAESQGRVEIATTLQTEISRMTKEAMQSANIDNMSSVESSFATVTSEVVKNVPLSGAVRDKIFQDKTGTVYVRMVINNSVVKNYLKANLENYSEAMKNADVSRDTIKKTNASLKNLFDELDLKTNSKQEIKNN